jgi:hypothetical protein
MKTKSKTNRKTYFSQRVIEGQKSDNKYNKGQTLH